MPTPQLQDVDLSEGLIKDWYFDPEDPSIPDDEGVFLVDSLDDLEEVDPFGPGDVMYD